MWRNEEFKAFLEWLRRHNDGIPASEKARSGVGIYGMDVRPPTRALAP